MSDFNYQKFQRELLKLGLSYEEEDASYLYHVAIDCAKKAGIPLGAAIGAATAGAGAVTVPVLGAIPGWMAGALTGFISGTAVCTLSRISMKRELDKILIHRN